MTPPPRIPRRRPHYHPCPSGADCAALDPPASPAPILCTTQRPHPGALWPCFACRSRNATAVASAVAQARREAAS